MIYKCVKPSLLFKEGKNYEFSYISPYYMFGDEYGFNVGLSSFDNGNTLFFPYGNGFEPCFQKLELWREQQLDKILNT